MNRIIPIYLAHSKYAYRSLPSFGGRLLGNSGLYISSCRGIKANLGVNFKYKYYIKAQARDYGYV